MSRFTVTSVGVNGICAGRIIHTRVGFTFIYVCFTVQSSEASDTLTSIGIVSIMTGSIIQAWVGRVTVVYFSTILAKKSRWACTVKCIIVIIAFPVILTGIWDTEIYKSLTLVLLPGLWAMPKHLL